MIYFDTSRTQKQSHRSGLTRVTRRLQEEFGTAVKNVNLLRSGKDGAGPLGRFPGQSSDWWLTAELFCEQEFPGLWTFVRARRCRLAAIYHDAIPLKFPHTSWPQSVSRHAEYMKMLAEFDQVFAVSEASRRELQEFWTWQGVEARATVETISLGADYARQPRAKEVPKNQGANVLCVGILEPRKNQGFLLEACERLWRQNVTFELHLVGRVNPHFGRPVLNRIKELQKTWRCLHFHEAIDDGELTRLYAKACVSVFPTLAEGCGLPLLESLWLGVPCVCSDLPVLRENGDGGGCVAVAPTELQVWGRELRRVLTDAKWRSELVRQAIGRPLPTWADTAKVLLDRLV